MCVISRGNLSTNQVNESNAKQTVVEVRANVIEVAVKRRRYKEVVSSILEEGKAER